MSETKLSDVTSSRSQSYSLMLLFKGKLIRDYLVSNLGIHELLLTRLTYAELIKVISFASGSSSIIDEAMTIANNILSIKHEIILIVFSKFKINM